MSVVFFTGSHPRHAFMARAIAATGQLAALVIEQREALVPAVPAGLAPATAELFQRHFSLRDAAEARHFGAAEWPDVPRLVTDMSGINAPDTMRFVNAANADVILSYGIHKLAPQTLAGLRSALKWNIHGGLSPWYRGVATHFWPSYFLEPRMTGMTVHELTEAIDGGDIIHQCAADLVSGDGLHDLACRAVMALGREMEDLLGIVARGALRPPQRQGTTGRIWRGVDWRPEHLHLIYELYGDQIVDRCLEGQLGGVEPKLIRQF